MNTTVSCRRRKRPTENPADMALSLSPASNSMQSVQLKAVQSSHPNNSTQVSRRQTHATRKPADTTFSLVPAAHCVKSAEIQLTESSRSKPTTRVTPRQTGAAGNLEEAALFTGVQHRQSVQPKRIVSSRPRKPHSV